MKPLFTSLLVCLLPFMAQAQDAIHISGITTEKDGSILIGAHIIAYDSTSFCRNSPQFSTFPCKIRKKIKKYLQFSKKSCTFAAFCCKKFVYGR